MYGYTYRIRYIYIPVYVLYPVGDDDSSLFFTRYIYFVTFYYREGIILEFNFNISVAL